LVSDDREPDWPETPGDIPFARWWGLKNEISLSTALEDAVFLNTEVVAFEVKHEASSDDKTSVQATEKPLSSKERNTLLIIIGVLCSECKLDYTKAAKTAGLIQGMAAFMKIRIGETTIEGYLKKIPDSLGTRTS